MSNYKQNIKLLFLTILAMALLTILITGYAYDNMSKYALNSNFKHLSSLQKSKIEEIKKWYSNYSKLVSSLANQKMTIDAFEKFNSTFYQLHMDLKIPKKELITNLKEDLNISYLDKVDYSIKSIRPKRNLNEYIPKNINSLIAQYLFTLKSNKNKITKTSYGKVHEIYHESYTNFLNAYNIYDIFMINLKGDLIYTNFKEKDYATNLLSGPYKDSGLASVYKKALKVKKNSIVFEDFKPYEPSYNTSASFIATPIYKDKQLIGVFAFQTSINQLNKMIHFNNKYHDVGLGKTGQSYLIGNDYKLRSDIRFLNESNKAKNKLDSLIGIYNVSSEVTKEALSSNNILGNVIGKNINNKEVLASYHRISLDSDVNWFLITEIETKEALYNSQKFRDNLILISFFIFSCIGLFVIVYINKIMDRLYNKEKELLIKNNKLQTEKQFTQTLMENGPIPIFHKDKEGKYTGINKEFEKMFGFKANEIIGKSVFDIAPKEVAQKYYCQDLELLNNKVQFQIYEFIVKNNKTGEEHNVVFYKKQLKDYSGDVIGIVGAILDISQRKKDEKKLMEYSKLLKDLNTGLQKQVDEEVSKNLKKEIQLFESAKLASMGSMIGNIIHQWKQPLSLISTIASGVHFKSDNNIEISKQEIIEASDLIIKSINRLNNVTKTFRNFLKEKKEFKEIVIQERIEESLVISGTILDDKGIVLIKNYNLDEKISIKTVPSELTEVIINIVNNAIDAIEEKNKNEGQVIVSLEKNDDKIIISVEDNAGGIPLDIMHYIFDEYYTTKDEEKGTGLGLYMSSKIVTESLKGKIYATNSKLGAKFYIELPII